MQDKPSTLSTQNSECINEEGRGLIARDYIAGGVDILNRVAQHSNDEHLRRQIDKLNLLAELQQYLRIRPEIGALLPDGAPYNLSKQFIQVLMGQYKKYKEEQTSNLFTDTNIDAAESHVSPPAAEDMHQPLFAQNHDNRGDSISSTDELRTGRLPRRPIPITTQEDTEEGIAPMGDLGTPLQHQLPDSSSSGSNGSDIRRPQSVEYDASSEKSSNHGKESPKSLQHALLPQGIEGTTAIQTSTREEENIEFASVTSDGSEMKWQGDGEEPQPELQPQDAEHVIDTAEHSNPEETPESTGQELSGQDSKEPSGAVHGAFPRMDVLEQPESAVVAEERTLNRRQRRAAEKAAKEAQKLLVEQAQQLEEEKARELARAEEERRVAQQAAEEEQKLLEQQARELEEEQAPELAREAAREEMQQKKKRKTDKERARAAKEVEARAEELRILAGKAVMGQADKEDFDVLEWLRPFSNQQNRSIINDFSKQGRAVFVHGHFYTMPHIRPFWDQNTENKIWIISVILGLYDDLNWVENTRTSAEVILMVHSQDLLDSIRDNAHVYAYLENPKIAPLIVRLLTQGHITFEQLAKSVENIHKKYQDPSNARDKLFSALNAVYSTKALVPQYVQNIYDLMEKRKVKPITCKQRFARYLLTLKNLSATTPEQFRPVLDENFNEISKDFPDVLKRTQMIIDAVVSKERSVTQTNLNSRAQSASASSGSVSQDGSVDHMEKILVTRDISSFLRQLYDAQKPIETFGDFCEEFYYKIGQVAHACPTLKDILQDPSQDTVELLRSIWMHKGSTHEIASSLTNHFTQLKHLSTVHDDVGIFVYKHRGNYKVTRELVNFFNVFGKQRLQEFCVQNFNEPGETVLVELEMSLMFDPKIAANASSGSASQESIVDHVQLIKMREYLEGRLGIEAISNLLTGLYKAQTAITNFEAYCGVFFIKLTKAAVDCPKFKEFLEDPEVDLWTLCKYVDITPDIVRVVPGFRDYLRNAKCIRDAGTNAAELFDTFQLDEKMTILLEKVLTAFGRQTLENLCADYLKKNRDREEIIESLESVIRVAQVQLELPSEGWRLFTLRATPDTERKR